MTLHQIHTSAPWWVKVLAPVLLSALIALIISAYGAYTHNDRDIIQRVTALEAKQVDDKDATAHIRDRVDKIYDILLEWSGKK